MSKTILVYCGSSKGHNPIYEAEAKALMHAFKKYDCKLIFGAGSVGIMGVLADEYLRLGGHVIGVIPSFMEPWEVKHTGIQECYVTETMHSRKQKMAELADGVIALPGGFGTLDELFEMLTWKQLDLHQMPISVLNTNGYYDHLMAQLQHMVTQCQGGDQPHCAIIDSLSHETHGSHENHKSQQNAGSECCSKSQSQ